MERRAEEEKKEEDKKEEEKKEEEKMSMDSPSKAQPVSVSMKTPSRPQGQPAVVTPEFIGEAQPLHPGAAGQIDRLVVVISY